MLDFNLIFQPTRIIVLYKRNSFSTVFIVFEKSKCFVSYVPKANSHKIQNIIFSVIKNQEKLLKILISIDTLNFTINGFTLSSPKCKK